MSILRHSRSGTNQTSDKRQKVVSKGAEQPAHDQLSADNIHHMQQQLGNRATSALINGRPAQPFNPQTAQAAPAVQRKPQYASAIGSAVQSGQVIQLAREYAEISGNAHLRMKANQQVYLDAAGKEHDGSDPAKAKTETIELIDESKGIGPKLENHWFAKNDRLIVDPTRRARPTTGGAGSYEWIWGQAGGYEGYIRKSKIKMTGTPAPTDTTLQSRTQAPPTINPAMEADVGDTAFSQVSEFAGSGLTDPLGERYDIEFLKKKEGGYYKDKEDVSKSMENTKNNLDIAAGSFDVFGGLLRLVQAVRGGQADPDIWDKVSAGFSGAEGIAKMVSGTSKIVDAGMKKGDNKGWDAGNKITGSVGEIFTTVRAFFDAIYKSVKLHRDWEKKGAGSKVKSIVDIIKSILEGTASLMKVIRGFIDYAGAGVSVGLTNAVPGLGIAIGAANIAMNGYNFMKAWISSQELKLIEHEQMNKVASTGSSAVKKKQEKFHMFSKLTSEVNTIDEEQLKAQKATATGTQKDELDKLDLIHELSNIQTKREVRSSVHIVTAMASIAGDIATLTGVGAQAGVPLKAIAAGVEGGMVGVRTFKQYGRDKGWSGFNADKSSEKKHQKRVDHAKLIMKIVSGLPTPYAEAHYQQYDMADKLLNATGIDKEELIAAATPEEQMAALIEAMKQRE